MRAGQTVPLSREQEQTLVEAIGKERRARLERIITNPRFQRLPEALQRNALENVLSAATREVNQRALTRISRGAPMDVELLSPAGR
jgi:hypothetical protein